MAILETIAAANAAYSVIRTCVEHGVREVSIKESDYFDGWGRYAITSFFTSKAKDV